jgi:Tfp pilus assembly protein PilX
MTKNRMPIDSRQESQNGFALASVLVVMVVLSILGAMVFRNVGTDITHSGKDEKRVRAEFAAESAIQWALAELSRKRGATLPFTLATHNPDGKSRMDGTGGEVKTGDGANDGQDMPTTAFQKSDLAEFPQAQMGMDQDGWMFKTTTSPEMGVSGGKNETLAFKVWYPNDSTLRISGKALVDGSTAELDLVSDLKEVAVPF